MPRKKTFTWKGVPVSRSTYFRNQRRAEASKGSAGVEIEQPTSGLLPEVAMLGGAPTADAPPDYPPTYHLLTEAEAALIGDLMVGQRAHRAYDNRFPIAVAPRVFAAIVSLLGKLGY